MAEARRIGAGLQPPGYSRCSSMLATPRQARMAAQTVRRELLMPGGVATTLVALDLREY
jgi:hypothetical protein